MSNSIFKFLSKKILWQLPLKVDAAFSIQMLIIPYRFKANRVFKALASMSFVVTLPFILTQIIIFWREAGYKLNQGPQIELLN